jgi:predicted nuclease of predicted toxin-antitoxin system
MTAQELTAHHVVDFGELKLLAGASAPCITIAIELPNPLELSVRLKNALRTVNKQLEDGKTETVEALLKPVRELGGSGNRGHMV